MGKVDIGRLKGTSREKYVFVQIVPSNGQTSIIKVCFPRTICIYGGYWFVKARRLKQHDRLIRLQNEMLSDLLRI